mmetsp:Transcript_11981/g.12043  ORF Transcript_11981/g.12043 Transcript_11981/m.12043 type:complete len:92 (-) Transcript_11981:1095-1370(-)
MASAELAAKLARRNKLNASPPPVPVIDVSISNSANNGKNSAGCGSSHSSRESSPNRIYDGIASTPPQKGSPTKKKRWRNTTDSTTQARRIS